MDASELIHELLKHPGDTKVVVTAHDAGWDDVTDVTSGHVVTANPHGWWDGTYGEYRGGPYRIAAIKLGSRG